MKEAIPQYNSHVIQDMKEETPQVKTYESGYDNESDVKVNKVNEVSNSPVSDHGKVKKIARGYNSPESDNVELKEVIEDIVLNSPPERVEGRLKDKMITNSPPVSVEVDNVVFTIGNIDNGCEYYELEEEVNVAQENDCINDNCYGNDEFIEEVIVAPENVDTEEMFSNKVIVAPKNVDSIEMFSNEVIVAPENVYFEDKFTNEVIVAPENDCIKNKCIVYNNMCIDKVSNCIINKVEIVEMEAVGVTSENENILREYEVGKEDNRIDNEMEYDNDIADNKVNDYVRQDEDENELTIDKYNWMTGNMENQTLNVYDGQKWIKWKKGKCKDKTEVTRHVNCWNGIAPICMVDKVTKYGTTKYNVDIDDEFPYCEVDDGKEKTWNKKRAYFAKLMAQEDAPESQLDRAVEILLKGTMPIEKLQDIIPNMLIKAENPSRYQAGLRVMIKNYGNWLRKNMAVKEIIWIQVTYPNGRIIKHKYFQYTKVVKVRQDVINALPRPPEESEIVMLICNNCTLDDDQYIIECGCLPGLENRITVVIIDPDQIVRSYESTIGGSPGTAATPSSRMTNSVETINQPASVEAVNQPSSVETVNQPQSVERRDAGTSTTQDTRSVVSKRNKRTSPVPPVREGTGRGGSPVAILPKEVKPKPQVKVKPTPKKDIPIPVNRPAERSVELENITEGPGHPIQNQNEYQLDEFLEDLEMRSPRSLDSNIHERQTNEMRNRYFSNWNQPIMHDNGGAPILERSWNDAVNYQREHMGQSEHYYPWLEPGNGISRPEPVRMEQPSYSYQEPVQTIRETETV